MFSLQILIVLVFIAIHVFAGKLRFLDVIPRSRWLSMAGGISVAYVFMHLFPELEEAHQGIREGLWGGITVEHPAYLVALLGLAIFYGLERLVKETRKEQGQAKTKGDETPVPAGVFWLHITSFAIYNGLIGYLLVHREEQDLRGLFFYSVAMGVHFLVNDHGLQKDHMVTYRRMGRWVLAGSVLIGWIAGRATVIPEGAIDLLFAFLAGGVVLNVLKEELPEERRSRFLSFASGMAVYTALLLLL